MRNAFPFVLVGSIAALLIACNDGGELTDAGQNGADAGHTPDASTRRDGGVDPVEDDAATPSDAGAHTDAGMLPDAGGSACDPRFSKECVNDSPFAPGFQCAMNLCMPDGREECGGFAGSTCPGHPDSAEAICLFYTGTDFGLCVTTAERDCLCAEYPDHV